MTYPRFLLMVMISRHGVAEHMIQVDKDIYMDPRERYVIEERYRVHFSG